MARALSIFLTTTVAIACGEPSLGDPALNSESLQRAPIDPRERFEMPHLQREVLPNRAEGTFTERIPDGPFAHYTFDISIGCNDEIYNPITGYGSIIDRIGAANGFWPSVGVPGSPSEGIAGGHCSLEQGISISRSWYTNSLINHATVPHRASLALGTSGLTITSVVIPEIHTDPRNGPIRFFSGTFVGKTDAWGLFLEDNEWVFRLMIAGPYSCEIRAPAWSLSDPSPIPHALPWRRLTATYDGTTMRLYMDATEVASAEARGTIMDSTGPLYIGGSPAPGDEMGALIDDLVFYRRALTASEIAGLANNPNGPNTWALYPGYPR